MNSQKIKYRIESNVPAAEVMIVPEARHYLGDQSERILSFLQRVNVESWNIEARSQKPEDRSQKSEVRKQKTIIPSLD